MAYTGFASFKAGVYPMPDPRHGTPGLVFTMMVPVLMFLASRRSAPALRTYLFLSALLLALVVPSLRGAFRTPWIASGVVQRLLALSTYVPIGVLGGYFLHHGPKPDVPSLDHAPP